MIYLLVAISIIVSVFIPSAWKIPPAITVCICVFWVTLLLFVLVIGKLSNFKNIGFETAAKYAKRYGFYFLYPNLSCFVSKIAAKWQLVSIVFCMLAYNWLATGFSLLMFVSCIFLRLVCSPIFFAEEGLRKYHADPKGAAFFSSRLQMLKAVYYKIHGESDPPC
jgi:hypothetical protein